MNESLHIDSLDFWHEVVCSRILEGECSQVKKEFRADIAVNRSSDVQVSRIRSLGHRFERTEKHIRRSDQDYFVLFLQVRGSAVQLQDGREVLVRPGELTCNDATRPFRLQLSDDFEQLIVHMPRAVVMGALGPTQRFTSIKVGQDTPLGSVLVPFLGDLATTLDDVSPGASAQLSQTAMSLAMTTLAEQSSIKLDHPTWSRNALLYRAEEFIQTHSWNSQLTSQAVAAALKVSLRYLQNLFQETERTPSEYIWECRLRNCERELGNPCLSALTVGDIALRGGFSDFAHFSHRFKRAYGVSPREFRARAQEHTMTLMESSQPIQLPE